MIWFDFKASHRKMRTFPDVAKFAWNNCSVARFAFNLHSTVDTDSPTRKNIYKTARPAKNVI